MSSDMLLLLRHDTSCITWQGSVVAVVGLVLGSWVSAAVVVC